MRWRLTFVRDWLIGMVDRLVHEYLERNAARVNAGDDRDR